MEDVSPLSVNTGHGPSSTAKKSKSVLKQRRNLEILGPIPTDEHQAEGLDTVGTIRRESVTAAEVAKARDLEEKSYESIISED